MSSLANIIAAAHRAKARLHGTGVTYRAGEASISIVAALKRRAIQVVEESDDTTVETPVEVWQIAVAELVDGDTPIQPAAGHTIVETLDGRVITYEVLPQADEPAGRYADQTRRLWKINTKQLSIVDA